MDEMNTLLLLLFVAIVCALPSALPISSETFANYHQEIIYPTSKNFFEHYSSQIPAGFKPVFRPVTRSILDFYESPKLAIRGPPQYPLFTPNNFDQRPETVGQIEEYKKALAEEAEERTKENEISSSDVDGLDGGIKSFVNVRGDSFKYNYRV